MKPIQRPAVGSVVAEAVSLRKVVLAVLVCAVAFLAVWRLVGPIRSGALLLLLANNVARADHDLPGSYEPLHKGHVDLSTGLYIREDEDLVVRGTPALILRRTHRSGYHIPREFGIGTTHSGEWFLGGDGEQFQWIELILPDGVRIRFTRTSSGTSYHNAMYEHRTSPSEWQGARAGWTGARWAVRRRDGSLFIFQPCGPGVAPTCWILHDRDSDGHTIEYKRDASGRLTRMEAASDRWIAFDYDRQDRITRAYASTRREVRYEYDERGRLALVRADDGRVHRYSYTDKDELTTIVDPGTVIENSYDENGRVFRQVNRFPDQTKPYIFDIAYRTEKGDVVQSDMKESDGTWTRYTYKAGYIVSETRGDKAESATFTYERDPETSVIMALTLTCPDRTGRPLHHSSGVGPGWDEWIKWDMLRTNCSWTRGHAPGFSDQ